MSQIHSFHIPVMGTGFTIDTPVKVAPYGIDSVISIIDHRLVEQMREYHCRQTGRPFNPISEKEDDNRARRITSYLNLVHEIVTEKFEQLKRSAFESGTEISKYFSMLSDHSPLKKEYLASRQLDGARRTSAEEALRAKIRPGSIDVNVMTKLDRPSYTMEGTLLPNEYNEAHAAIRGFANSNLHSSVVLSAGLNPRLYSYMASFDSFLPDNWGAFAKKIILKVSDYRSALVQGRFLAKKGLWVSEFRIESGLNCGGHAFATDGYLLGPILEEFNQKRHELVDSLFESIQSVWQGLNKTFHTSPPPIRVTAQGGVGTAEEHRFLLENYKVDSVGWGSPFLLVPEAVNVDAHTRELLRKGDESQFYLSDVSPLGIRFNTIRGTSAERRRDEINEQGTPGHTCYKKHLSFNTDFSEKPICLASKTYQNNKIAELKDKGLQPAEFARMLHKITEKVCLCMGLGNSLAAEDKVGKNKKMEEIAICPGPNTAYFTRIVSLHEMIDHIYGKANILEVAERPNMFIKELSMYIDYLKEKLGEYAGVVQPAQIKFLHTFQENLHEGIRYYQHLVTDTKEQFDEALKGLTLQLQGLQLEFMALQPDESN